MDGYSPYGRKESDTTEGLLTPARGEGGEGREDERLPTRWVPQHRRSHRILPGEGRECRDYPGSGECSGDRASSWTLPSPTSEPTGGDAKKGGATRLARQIVPFSPHHSMRTTIPDGAQRFPGGVLCSNGCAKQIERWAMDREIPPLTHTHWGKVFILIPHWLNAGVALPRRFR